MLKENLKKRESKYLLFDITFLGLIIANTIGFAMDYYDYGYSWPVLLYLLFDVIFIALYFVGRLWIKVDMIMTISLAILNLVEFPIILYFFGTNVLVYLVIGLICNVTLLKWKNGCILSIITLLVDLIVMVIAYYHTQNVIPELFETVEELEARYQNTIAYICYFIGSIISILIVSVLISRINRVEKKNKELLEIIEESSLRDPLTMVFNKKFITEYITRLIDEKRDFIAGVYKISSYNQLEYKYGPQYLEVMTVTLSELLLKESVGKAVVARYSKNSFIIVFNEPANAIEIASSINMKIDGGAMSEVSVSRALEKINDKDTIDSYISRLGDRVRGYGEAYETNDIL